MGEIDLNDSKSNYRLYSECLSCGNRVFLRQKLTHYEAIEYIKEHSKVRICKKCGKEMVYRLCNNV